MTENNSLLPRLVVSGLAGGSGKTMVSLGLTRALSLGGLRVKTFKKGPDYIDAAWLALAAGTAQGNLDPFFSTPDELLDLYAEGSLNHDFCLIEGNRGLFDGMDLAGSCSTAFLARTLQAPVLLVLDCTKMTRTAAAVVHGCRTFEPDLNLGGVILNRVGTARQERLLREAVETLAGVPVMGCLPRLAEAFIQERHMGLQCVTDAVEASRTVDEIAAFLADHVDMGAIRDLAATARPLATPLTGSPVEPLGCKKKRSAGELSATYPPYPSPAALPQGISGARSLPLPKPVIGYVRDAALWFYYQENLQALATAGADLVAVSILTKDKWPKLDGLYIGGGLPELSAETLAANSAKRSAVRSMSLDGIPIYAECGGFMYLSSMLVLEQVEYPMAGVFPHHIGFSKKPRGLGYIEATVVSENPFHPKGCSFRGHEFHFSHCISKISMPPVLHLTRGEGTGSEGTRSGKGEDGLLFLRTFASYMHIYAPAVPHWAPAFVAACRT